MIGIGIVVVVPDVFAQLTNKRIAKLNKGLFWDEAILGQIDQSRPIEIIYKNCCRSLSVVITMIRQHW